MKINPRFIPIPDMTDPANISKLASSLAPQFFGAPNSPTKIVKVLAIKIGPKPTAHKSSDPMEIPDITDAEELSGQKFPLGKVIATALVRQKVCPACVGYAIRCHCLGNWGEVSEFDAMANEEAVKTGGRILSAFICCGGAGRFLVVTEADRSVTTVMLPEEA